MYNKFIREGLLFLFFVLGVIPFLVLDSWIGGALAFLTHCLVLFAFSQKVRPLPVLTVYCRKGPRLTQRSSLPLGSTIQVDRPRAHSNKPGTDNHDLEKASSAKGLEKESTGSSPNVMLQNSFSGENRSQGTIGGKSLHKGLTPQLELTPPV